MIPIVKFFTHEPTDLEPIFHFLSSLPTPAENYLLWESRYVLLLWLSLIVMIPFDLKRVDSEWGVPGKKTLVDKIIDMAKRYLSSTGKEHEGAAIVLARLLTRYRDIFQSIRSSNYSHSHNTILQERRVTLAPRALPGLVNNHRPLNLQGLLSPIRNTGILF